MHFIQSIWLYVFLQWKQFNWVLCLHRSARVKVTYLRVHERSIREGGGGKKKNKKQPHHWLSALNDACILRANGKSTGVFANLLYWQALHRSSPRVNG